MSSDREAGVREPKLMRLGWWGGGHGPGLASGQLQVLCRPSVGKKPDKVRKALPDAPPPPLRLKQGRTTALPNTPRLQDQNLLFISLQLDPGLMIMKQRLTAQPWQGSCQGPPQKR